MLCKGGHQLNDANDLLWRDGTSKWFNGKRIDNPNTHGTGCTLSSAIASNLAKGYDLDTSVQKAKAYISGALAATSLGSTESESAIARMRPVPISSTIAAAHCAPRRSLAPLTASSARN